CDDSFRVRPAEPRAPVFDYAIAAGHPGDQGDDRVVRYSGVDGYTVEGRQNWTVGAQIADGVERVAVQLAGEHVGSVQPLEPGDSRSQLRGSLHETGHDPADRSVGNWATSVRRGDENDTSHEGQGLEDQKTLQLLTDLRRGAELILRNGNRGIPEH